MADSSTLSDKDMLSREDSGNAQDRSTARLIFTTLDRELVEYFVPSITPMNQDRLNSSSGFW